jgi:lysine 2,3-aminomutase
MADIIEKIGVSIIHYGKSSNRIYIMSLDKSDFPGILQKFDELAEKNGYTKIVAKIPVCEKEIFELNGYEIEALIPNFLMTKKMDVLYVNFFRVIEK